MSAETDMPDRRDHDTPETLQLRSISPSITVGDIEASRAWYRDVLGFHVKETWEDDEGKLMGVQVVAGSANVYMAQDDWAKGRDRVKGEGFRLHMVTGDDVDAIAAGIEARGGTLEAQPADMPWGARAFSLVDPDGFKLTISTEM
jgi:uncharacterized glyoxalase superfamily protein PhnB